MISKDTIEGNSDSASSVVTPGMILVADPQFTDPAFTKSVILILFNEGGAMGVNIASEWMTGPHHVGGPMPGGPLIGIAPVAEEITSLMPIGDSGYALSLFGPDYIQQPDYSSIKQQSDSMLLVGYAGWGPYQLEGEIEMGWWSITTVSLETLLKTPLADRWSVANSGTKNA